MDVDWWKNLAKVCGLVALPFVIATPIVLIILATNNKL